MCSSWDDRILPKLEFKGLICVPSKVPSGVPRRLCIQLLWDSESLYHWTVIKDMGKVPPVYILAAFIPAVMITGIYFFDLSVASTCDDYNLIKLTDGITLQ
ncbi:boron transporter 4-like [Lactuca sativa]|uniref:boron transporter 4-like n=1 Tax=Lactuca sativa TaxID=4236 RepID=UPI000CD8B341|nr:boron transporter 4-like [Lactuca sativa]